MIDFRYHLVSLISVFLALAVGIVLGAGPLRESLGTQLAGQVEQLRTDMEDLRTRNDRLAAQNDQLGTYITETAPDLVAGTLTGRSVALITDSATTRDPLDATQELVTAAGGTTMVRVTLGEMLWSPAGAEERSTALTALRSAAPDLTLIGEDDGARLASAVAVVLTAPADALPASQRSAALTALVDSRVVTVDGELTGPVDAVVYGGAASADLVDPGDSTGDAALRAQSLGIAQTSLLEVLVTEGVPTVVAGATPGSDDAVGVIRLTRGDARFDALSTVDGLQRADGPPVVVLALAEQLHGGAGDYGTGAGASARVPALPAPSGGASDGGGAG